MQSTMKVSEEMKTRRNEHIKKQKTLRVLLKTKHEFFKHEQKSFICWSVRSFFELSKLLPEM